MLVLYKSSRVVGGEQKTSKSGGAKSKKGVEVEVSSLQQFTCKSQHTLM